MKHQLQAIREALTHRREGEPYLSETPTAKALTALAELERMAGEPCGWYDDDRVYWHEGKQPANGADLYTAAPVAQHAAIQRKDALLRQALDAVENVNTTMPFLVAHELRQAITKELAK